MLLAWNIFFVALARLSAYNGPGEGKLAMEKAEEVFFKNLDDITVVVQSKLPTSKNKTEIISVSKASLDKANTTLEEIEKSVLMVDEEGGEYLKLPNGRELAFNVHTENVYVFGKNQSYVIQESGLMSRTMEDLKDDTSLIPLKYPKLTWLGRQPTRCTVENIHIELGQKNFTIAVTGNQPIIKKMGASRELRSFGRPEQGIFMLVVHPLSCKITFNQSFYTHNFGAHRDLVKTLNEISPGRLVVLASQKDGSFELGDARSYLSNLTSQFIDYFHYKDAWINVFLSGGKILMETLVPNIRLTDDTSAPVSVHVKFSPNLQNVLSHIDGDCLQWPNANRWFARRWFCENRDGYGDLCSCESPFTLDTKHSTVNDPATIPILIIAGNRTQYLYRLLASFEGQGITRNTILLSVDGVQEDTLRLAYILGIKALVHRPEGKGVSTVSTNMRFGLYHILRSFPKATSFIILEDDLIVSPDFYSYMKQLNPIFKLDPSVFCVNAFNHFSFPHTEKDPRKVYRAHTLPALGWMVSRETVEYVLPKFLPVAIEQDWDYFIGSEHIRGNRSVIIPDINRSYHGGTRGLHLNADWNSESMFSIRNYNKYPNVKLYDIERIKESEYDKEMDNLLTNAKHITDENLLEESFPDDPGGVYLVFVQRFNFSDDIGCRSLFKDLGVWHSDCRDGYYDAYRFYYRNATVIIIGYPMSKYSYMIRAGDTIAITDEKRIKDYKESSTRVDLKRLMMTHLFNANLPEFVYSLDP